MAAAAVGATVAGAAKKDAPGRNLAASTAVAVDIAEASFRAGESSCWLSAAAAAAAGAPFQVVQDSSAGVANSSFLVVASYQTVAWKVVAYQTAALEVAAYPVAASFLVAAAATNTADVAAAADDDDEEEEDKIVAEDCILAEVDIVAAAEDSRRFY